MSGWEQVAGSSENDPLKLAESGEKQQWSFRGTSSTSSAGSGRITTP